MQNLSGNTSSGRFILRVKCDEYVAKNILAEIPDIKSAEVVGCREKDTVDVIVESRNNADIRESVFNAFAVKQIAILMNKPMEKTIEDIFVKVIGETEGETETTFEEKKSFLDKIIKRGKK